MTAIATYTTQAGESTPAGTAYITRRRSTLTTAFAYTADYLASPGAYAIDPELRLTAGTSTQGLPQPGLPGAFTDAAPDRWGRNLIAKRIRAQAAADGRAMPTVSDVDYLLGVSDETRQGALRFKLDASTEFLHTGHDVPRLIELPALLRAAEQVARSDLEEMTAIKLLLDAGTGSLGGARPKASVRDGGRLLIAKFAHPDDEWSVIGWEKTALDLASAAGIDTPRTELLHVEGKPVLVLDRFDRAGEERIGYMSTMTLIGARDGQSRDYVEIAEQLAEVGSAVSADLEQLWRRIAFSIAIHNTDDHLRNHGLLRHGSGWALSPAFDINPNPDLGAVRVTGVGGSAGDHPGDIVGLLAHADTFGLSWERASTIIREVCDAARGYRGAARTNAIPEAEIERFARTLDATISALGDSVAN